jgi:hypothetical protein
MEEAQRCQIFEREFRLQVNNEGANGSRLGASENNVIYIYEHIQPDVALVIKE